MENKVSNINKMPQAIDLEEAIIGACLIDRKGIDEAVLVFQNPNVFYKPEHVLIYDAIMHLYNSGNPVDLLTVSDALKRSGNLEKAGGDFNLIRLTQKISSSAHVEFHCRIVLQKYISRAIINFSHLVIGLAHDETTDVFELIERWQKEFDNVVDFTNTGRTTMSFPEALENLVKEVELLTNNKSEVKLVGIDTGFKSLNKFTGGYRNQDLVVIAARPGMGKTSYVLKSAIDNCKRGNGVGLVSLEMSIEQLTARCVAIDTNFHLKQLLKTGFEHTDYFSTYRQHQDRMKGYPLYIDDSGKTDITDIVITAKLWVRKYDIKVLIIDYIQLITDRSVKGNRESEISSISRRLKRLAKELNIPVIALSQLSRAVETRGHNKRPMLSDLRESGAIEQDADIVQFIYRPGYYDIEVNAEDYDKTNETRVMLGADSEIIFAKYRGGSTGVSLLKWVGDKTKFVCVDDVTDTVEYIHREAVALPTPYASEAFDVNENDGLAF